MRANGASRSTPSSSEGKFNPAKNQLRDHIAVDKNDAWAHLRLGDLYADAVPLPPRRLPRMGERVRLEPALKSDAAFRKSVCETVDANDTQRRAAVPARALRRRRDAAAAARAACAPPPTRAASRTPPRLIEAVSGAERPELAMAALRILDVGKTLRAEEEPPSK